MKGQGWQQREVKILNLPDDLAEEGLEEVEWDVAVKNASWYRGDMAPCKGEQPNSMRTGSVKISACFLSSKLQDSQTLFLSACKWLNHYQVLRWQVSILLFLREQSAFRSKSWVAVFLQQPWGRQSTPVTLTSLCSKCYLKFSLFLNLNFYYWHSNIYYIFLYTFIYNICTLVCTLGNTYNLYLVMYKVMSVKYLQLNYFLGERERQYCLPSPGWIL